MNYLNFKDGPSSSNFKPLQISSDITVKDLDQLGVSKKMIEKNKYAPNGSCVFWGIPFEIGQIVVIKDKPISVTIPQIRAEWFVFMHTSDIQPIKLKESGFLASMTGEGRLNEPAGRFLSV